MIYYGANESETRRIETATPTEEFSNPKLISTTGIFKKFDRLFKGMAVRLKEKKARTRQLQFPQEMHTERACEGLAWLGP